MSRVTASLLLLFYTNSLIAGLPVRNGFRLKFSSLLKKDENRPKIIGSIFTKISQDLSPEAILRQQIFSLMIKPPAPQLGTGCSNQVARKVPLLREQAAQQHVDTTSWNSTTFYHLPIIKQPFKDYKVIVATAPPDIRIGRGEDRKNVVVYVIFNEDENENQEETMEVPEIYFVNRISGINKIDPDEKPGLKSAIVVDNNRTLTGINSKHVQKLLTFRNKPVNRYSYNIVA
ncbi:hypothetical protein NE865_15427 [Phthorimaea operculella]|nr:hypothetical protein NE865_15427 [Phthorimaea operculella]